MNLNDVFNRKKKGEFTPLSLFPADSKCLTSLPIGRVVPVYRNSLIQGNKIMLDASGVARMMTMNAPVLNDYKLVLSAYFVPYTSFDDFFKSTYMRNKIYNNTSNVSVQSKILHAREFFDGATPNADRVHPISVPFSTLGGTKLVGSLADHLGYFIASNVDISSTTAYFGDIATTSGNRVAKEYTEAFNSVSKHCVWNNDNEEYSGSNAFGNKATGTACTTHALCFDAYALCLQGASDYLSSFNGASYPIVGNDGNENVWRDSLMIAVTQRELFGLQVPTALYTDANDPKLKWSYWYGDMTVSDITESYHNYITDYYKMLNSNIANFSANVIPWLTYHRIYSDYFLNENLIDAEDFRDVIGEAYLNKATQTSRTLSQLFTAKADAKITTVGNYKIKDRADLGFFASYMAKGECLPVPWAKDYFTGAQVETTSINGGTPFANFKNTNGGSSTPVGSTIDEFRFNKIYAKFKDLVARFGYSYKKNTGAIYGHTPSDDTLNRSQSLGMREFSVNVGSVMQTSSSTDNSTLGSFAGVGATGINGSKWEWTADESGEFMVLAWVVPTSCANVYGLDRSIFKTSYYDYLLPQFGGIDYQDLYTGEVYPTGSNDTNRFAYVERYWEYMMSRDTVTGEMRNKYKDWTSDRFLTSRPSISLHSSPEFFYMTNKDDLHRVFMDGANDPVIAKINFNGTVTRQLPEKIMTDL